MRTMFLFRPVSDQDTEVIVEDEDSYEIIHQEEPMEQEVELSDLSIARELYAELMSDKLSVDDVCSSHTLQKLHHTVVEHREKMTFRTAQLWLQYMDMVDILRKFIKVERTGNWNLHLQSVFEMLPYFASSGRSLYAKSACVFTDDASTPNPASRFSQQICGGVSCGPAE